jgi:hypothetical protein
MTGMPARRDHSDQELWATIAFLQKLPGMSEEDYAKLAMATIAHSGHHHIGSDDGHPEETAPDSDRHH